jgi:hypothetical protein
MAGGPLLCPNFVRVSGVRQARRRAEDPLPAPDEMGIYTLRHSPGCRQKPEPCGSID